MQTIISGHHLEITPAINNYVEKKFSRLQRHFEKAEDVRIILSADHPAGHSPRGEREARKMPNASNKKAECNIHVKGHDFFAHSEHPDLYAAIDLLIDKIDTQIHKHKSKAQSHHNLSLKDLSLQSIN